MSRRDGIGEVDGFCHECGRSLPEPYTGETELCEVCDVDEDYFDDDRCELCGRVHCTDADDEQCEEEEHERRMEALYKP